MYCFDEIYGSELIKKSLQKAAKSKNTTHAYIIAGGEGCGKTLITRTFAKALQCEANEAVPCGGCISCKTFDSMNHPDVIYVEPTKAKSIGVDDIREQVLSPMAEKPFLYRYKIFIIENGDTMTPAAQNALLKALEEPADYGVFLITATNAGKFLPTVMSRAMLLKIKPLPDKLVYKYLTEKAGVPPQTAQNCYVYAGGSIGRALKLINDEGFIELKKAAENIVAGKKETIAEILKTVVELEIFKPRVNDLLNILFLLYRDIIVYKACEDEKYITWMQNSYFIKNEALSNDMKSLYKKLETVLNTMEILSKNANYTLSMEVLLMEL